MREKKKELTDQYQAKAKEIIEKRKKEIDIELNKAKENAEKELLDAVTKLQKIYNEKGWLAWNYL